MIRLACGVLVLLALALPAPADCLFLTDGTTVQGKVERIDHRSVRLRTADGTVEYDRRRVAAVGVIRLLPDGRRALVKTLLPQPVKLPFEVETKHYVIKTDVSEVVARKAARAMEQIYRAYAEIFDLRANAQPRKVEVLIYKTKHGFDRYCKSIRLKIRPTALGFYRTSLAGDHIVTYYRNGREFGTLSTLYHEGTHQFVMMVMGRKNPPPLWVNEGLAVYFENSRWRNGKFKTGVIPRKRLLLLQKRLRSGKYVPLADLMKRERDTYDAVCYSEGWALVYFFVKAHNGRYAKRFGKYFRLLKKGADPDEAFATCFTRDLAKLERAWKRFVLRLKVPPR